MLLSVSVSVRAVGAVCTLTSRSACPPRFAARDPDINTAQIRHVPGSHEPYAVALYEDSFAYVPPDVVYPKDSKRRMKQSLAPTCMKRERADLWQRYPPMFPMAFFSRCLNTSSRVEDGLDGGMITPARELSLDLRRALMEGDTDRSAERFVSA